jgi:hypothetical protein
MPVSSNHAATPFRRAARPLLAIAWAGLIFLASSRPDLRVSDDHLLDLVLRKAAHLFVFGVLAVLVARALRGEGLERRATLIAAWITTLAYAASDEWHQTFVQGRVGHPSDVAIDMVGASVGLLVLQRAWRGAATIEGTIE